MLRSSPVEDPWLTRLRGSAAPVLRLVCFPHAGGSASAYALLARALPEGVEVYAVNYPGRQARLREPAVESLTGLADLITPVLTADRRTGVPLALFGHSMGATVAYEVARRLERAGRHPVRLVVSGRRAPTGHQKRGLDTHDDAQLVAELARMGGTAPEVLAQSGLLELVLPALRADLRAVETYRYRPGPLLRCPISALVGGEDEGVTPEHAAAWSAHTAGGFDLTVFPGGHFYLDAQREDVAATLGELLLATHGAEQAERVDRMEWVAG